jgi:predicted enzyme related to lactoylglutathione lyase
MNRQDAQRSGRFVWHELHTGDRRGALDFYCMLLGWQTREILLGDEPYGLCISDGRDHAGVVQSTAPPHWLPYLAVDDIDACMARVERLRGKVVRPPTEIRNIGPFAVLADPQGARFAVHRHATPQPVEPESPPVGEFCWDDLMTTEPEQAAEFYASLFGFAVEVVDTGPCGTHRILSRGSRSLAGIMSLPAGAPAAAHWLTYIHVKDVDRTLRNAKEVGGTVEVAGREIPGVGRFGVVADPTGASFAVFRGVRGT